MESFNSIYIQSFDIESRVPGTLFCEPKHNGFNFGKDAFVKSGDMMVKDMLREYTQNSIAA